jgi:hypothetical protein
VVDLTEANMYKPSDFVISFTNIAASYFNILLKQEPKGIYQEGMFQFQTFTSVSYNPPL